MVAGAFCATHDRWVIAEGPNAVTTRRTDSRFYLTQNFVRSGSPAPTGGARSAYSHAIRVSRFSRWARYVKALRKITSTEPAHKGNKTVEVKAIQSKQIKRNQLALLGRSMGPTTFFI